MRLIVAFDRVSADGYFADTDGGLGWAVPEPELDRGVAERLSGTGTILFGRRTYDMFERFWPTAVRDDGPAADPHAPGRLSPEMRAMADWINAAEKIVFSRTRPDVTWNNSRLLRELDPREVRAMKEGPGPQMMIFGSGSIVSQLTEHGLVDEYQLIVCPVLIGNGRPLVSGVATSRRLELAEATPFPSGNVRLRYTLAG
jgi:dihydrofolate reductase